MFVFHPIIEPTQRFGKAEMNCLVRASALSIREQAEHSDAVAGDLRFVLVFK